jgi:exopolysaccharide production protein ExoY
MTTYQRITSERQASALSTHVVGLQRPGVAALPEAIFAPKSDSYVRIMKPAFDRLAAACLLLVLSPLIILASLAIVLTSGWPPWYQSRRVGLNGREFLMIKIRTMRRDADAVLARLLESSPTLRLEFSLRCKLADDPRVTRLGRIYRSLSIDELPQLVNVLLGHMSLVGPRPVPQDEMDRMYGPSAPLVSAVRPGITGLWQTNGRSATTYAERVAADLRYVATLSPLTDVKILLGTVRAVLTRRGAE